jgi:hypothetical protein
LASQTVQVTSDAKANPIITAFTMMSTFMNIDHDDRSRGRAPGRSHCSWLGCCRCGGLGVDEVRGLARRCPRRVLCRGGMRRGNGGGRVRRGRRDRWRPALGQRRGLWRQYGANQTGPTSSRGSNTQRHGIWPSVTHLAVHLVIPTPQNACAFAPMALRGNHPGDSEDYQCKKWREPKYVRLPAHIGSVNCAVDQAPMARAERCSSQSPTFCMRLRHRQAMPPSRRPYPHRARGRSANGNGSVRPGPERALTLKSSYNIMT